MGRLNMNAAKSSSSLAAPELLKLKYYLINTVSVPPQVKMEKWT